MTQRALILDCDGVLAETELDGHLVSFNQAFEQLGFPFRWTADEYGMLLRVGGGKERLTAYLNAHPEYSIGSEDRLNERVRAAHKLKSEIYVDLIDSGAIPGRQGVARIVGEALDAGWQVACASTSARQSVEAVLVSTLGIDQRSRMAGVFAGDIVSAKKPAPDIYLLAATELGRDASEIVVIEDSQSGAAAAAAAGMALLVTVSHFTADDDFTNATTVVDSLGDAGRPATLIDGLEVRNAEGFLDLASLDRLIQHHLASRS